jgi:hypothetical protein
VLAAATNINTGVGSSSRACTTRKRINGGSAIGGSRQRFGEGRGGGAGGYSDECAGRLWESRKKS